MRTFAESSAHTMEKLHRLTTMGGNVFDASVPFQVAWVYCLTCTQRVFATRRKPRNPRGLMVPADYSLPD
jgi:hypothetical protein